MSREDLFAVIGRSRLDLEFGSRLSGNFEEIVKSAGYNLTAEEIGLAKQNMFPKVMPQPGTHPDIFQQQLAMKNANAFADLNISIHRSTFENASNTYRRVSRMSEIMFVTGIGLFIFAALYGAFAQQLTYTFVFAGLGAANFIALFILKPMDKSQEALSNLLQAEIAFMNHSNQLSLWSMYAAPKGFPPQPDLPGIKTASQELQKLTRETMDLLQTYLETPVDRSAPKESAGDKTS
nr:hypothetical protein [uncultured Methanoregula sp.]